MNIPLSMVTPSVLKSFIFSLLADKQLMYDYANEDATRVYLVVKAEKYSITLSTSLLHGDAYQAPDDEFWFPLGYDNQSVDWSGDDEANDLLLDCYNDDWIASASHPIAAEAYTSLVSYYDNYPYGNRTIKPFNFKGNLFAMVTREGETTHETIEVPYGKESPLIKMVEEADTISVDEVAPEELEWLHNNIAKHCGYPEWVLHTVEHFEVSLEYKDYAGKPCGEDVIYIPKTPYC